MKVLAVVVLAGCLPEPSVYRCNSDADCGESGACFCEAGSSPCDGVCTFGDLTCPGSNQRFGALSGDRADTCVPPPPSRALAHPCVAGSPSPTSDQVCASEVCDRLPQCCTGVWIPACVQVAATVAGCNARCSEHVAVAEPDGVHFYTWNEPASNTTMTPIAIANVPGATALAWVSATTAAPALVIARDHQLSVADPLDGQLHAGLELGEPITALAAGDADGDGDMDIAAALASGAIELFTLELQRIAIQIEPVGAGPIDGLVWGDYNAGRADLFARRGAHYDVYRRTESSFESSVLGGVVSGGDVVDTPLVDVDGDGDLDFFPLGRQASVLNLYVNGDFTGKHEFRTLGDVMTIGDLDGDGQPELVIAHNEPPRHITVRRGFAAGQITNVVAAPYTQSFNTEFSGQISRLAISDVDGDRRLDLVAVTTAARGGIVWFRVEATPDELTLVIQAPRVLNGEVVALTGW